MEMIETPPCGWPLTIIAAIATISIMFGPLIFAGHIFRYLGVWP